jgi:hypothetical protein
LGPDGVRRRSDFAKGNPHPVRIRGRIADLAGSCQMSVRYPVLLITISLVFTSLTLVAQKPDSATQPAAPDFLPAGPFFFEPGAIHPTYMDAFDNRRLVKSPDGKAQITITGPRESLKAWITVQFLAEYMQGLEYRVWPVQGGSVDVLWRPDSQAFALTDNRYANRSYVLVFGADFRMGENGAGLGVPITDLTSIVEKAFEERAKTYYGSQSYDTLLFYAKVLRWIGDDNLLIGASAKTEGPATFPNRGIRDWDVAYRVDLPHKSVLGELSAGQLLSQYGIKVAQ